MMKLTDKEQLLYNSILQGMDQPKCGWLHELDPFNNSRVGAGAFAGAGVGSSVSLNRQASGSTQKALCGV